MIISLADLHHIRQKHLGQTVVLGSGVFDLIHRGHLAYLNQLRQHGDIVVVFVKSDERVRKGKGADRPVLPEQDRLAMVDAIKGVDYAFTAAHLPFAGHDIDPLYAQIFSQLQPDVFYSTNRLWQQLEQLGQTKVVIGQRPDGQSLRSTTDIIRHIRRHPGH